MSGQGKPLVIAIAADVKDVSKGVDQAKADLGGLADAAQTEGRRAAASLDGVAESSDALASGSSQVAGGLGDLGGALGLLPGPLGALGRGMELAQVPIMGVTGASDLLNAATEKFPGVAKVAAAGARGLGVAMRFATGPIGLIIIGAIALGAALVLAYKKSATFRAVVDAAFNGVKKAGALLWTVLKTYVGLYVGAFHKVTSVAGTIGSAFAGVYRTVVKWLGAAWSYISGLPGKIKGAFSGVWSGLAGGLKSAINSVLHLPLTIPVIDTHIPGVGKVGGQTLIPALANGGIVDRATLALVGEAGPEAVIPLPRLSDFLGSAREWVLTLILSADAIDDIERGRTYKRRISAADRAGARVAAR